MNGNWDKTNFNTFCKKNLGKNQIMVEGNLVANFEDGEISKLLSVKANLEIVSTECLLGEVNYSGKAYVNFIFVTTSNKIENKSTIIDFSGKFSDSLITPTSKISTKSTLIDNISTSIANNNVKFNFYVETEFHLFDIYEIDAVSGGEGLITKDEELTVNSFYRMISENSNVEQKLEVNEKVENVIFTNVTLKVLNTNSINNYASIEYQLKTEVFYSYIKDEVMLYKKVDKTETFKHDMAFDGITDKTLLCADVRLKAEPINETLETLDSKTAINLVIPLSFWLVASNEMEVKYAEDVYSLTNELNLSLSTYLNQQNLESVFIDKKLSSDITLDKEDERIEKIIYNTNPNFVLTNYENKETEVIVEGIAYTTIVYLSGDELEKRSIEVEIPFSFKENCENSTGTSLWPVINLKNIDVYAKKGREFEIELSIEIELKRTICTSYVYISDVEVADEFEPCPYALEIYYVKPNETIWDISKKLRTTTDDILNQNPKLTLPLNENDKLVIYRQQTNF